MVTRYATFAEFRGAVESRLLAREVENDLALGIIAGGVDHEDNVLLAVGDEGVALYTPPYGLCVTRMPADAMRALVDWLRDVAVVLPGAVGASDVVSAFVAMYAPGARCKTRMRLFENRALVPPRAPADGTFRHATVADLERLLEWTLTFSREAGAVIATAEAIERRTRAGDFGFWCVGDDVVAMACLTRRTRTSTSIAYVYTPPACRRRGYASACVAALTAEVHAAGRTAFLFADRGNPTANKIYEAIGFTAVGDVDEWSFTSH